MFRLSQLLSNFILKSEDKPCTSFEIDGFPNETKLKGILLYSPWKLNWVLYNENGIIEKVYEKVKTTSHARDILKDLG